MPERTHRSPSTTLLAGAPEVNRTAERCTALTEKRGKVMEIHAVRIRLLKFGRYDCMSCMTDKSIARENRSFRKVHFIRFRNRKPSISFTQACFHQQCANVAAKGPRARPHRRPTRKRYTIFPRARIFKGAKMANYLYSRSLLDIEL